MDEQQSQKVKAIDDQQAEVGNEKKPYHTPTLTRLGNVTQLTRGGHPAFPTPDDSVLSGP